MNIYKYCSIRLCTLAKKKYLEPEKVKKVVVFFSTQSVRHHPPPLGLQYFEENLNQKLIYNKKIWRICPLIDWEAHSWLQIPAKYSKPHTFGVGNEGLNET